MTKLLNILPRVLDAKSSEAWANDIFNALQKFLVPFLIILCGVGLIWAVVVGVQMIKADTKDAMDNNKKRLINIGITVISVIALIAVFFALKSWIPGLVASAEGEFADTTTTTMIGMLFR